MVLVLCRCDLDLHADAFGKSWALVQARLLPTVCVCMCEWLLRSQLAPSILWSQESSPDRRISILYLVDSVLQASQKVPPGGAGPPAHGKIFRDTVAAALSR